ERAFRYAVSRWLPYLGVFAFYLYWRLVMFLPAYPRVSLASEFQTNPLCVFTFIAERIGIDFWKSAILAWGNLLEIRAMVNQRFLWLGMGIILAALLAVFFLKRNDFEAKDIKSALGFILFGLIAFLAGGLPLWASGTPLEITFPWTRATLCVLAGISITAAGLLALLPRKSGIVALSFLTGLSMSFQIYLGLDFRCDWDHLRGIFQQLVEKAPGLKPGTMVLFEDLNIRYYSGNSLTPLLNWIYDPEAVGDGDWYRAFEISERLGSLLPALEPGIAVRHGGFTGTTSQTIVITLDADGQLMILEPGSPLPPGASSLLTDAWRISNPGEVIDFSAPDAELPDFMLEERTSKKFND
ncbi:MAG TPA: hypothetical protein VMW28_00490, partial [Pelolinea sp.]|nr:hypothetical protein [Pelolinea sp.]